MTQERTKGKTSIQLIVKEMVDERGDQSLTANMIAWVRVLASSRAFSNACICSATNFRPSTLLTPFLGGVPFTTGVSVPSISNIPDSHFSIFSLLRSALSHSDRHPPSLFFSARIFRPASVVAAALTWVCSEIVAREDATDVVKVRKWAS